MIRIHTGVFLIAALLLLILPLDWIAAVAVASLFHELCHIVALYSVGGGILKIEVKPDGCVIETGRIGEWKQFVSILAGPLGSFSLLLFCRSVPMIAICGLFQGLYNLIPVLPLDGGRLLQLLLYQFCPKKAEQVMAITAIGSCLIVDFLAAWFVKAASPGPGPFLLALIWNIRTLPRKIPCNAPEIGVQ